MDLAAELIPTVPDDARLISSPSRRAVETAAAIAAALGHDPAQVEIDARWSEADFGVAEGLTFDELSAIAPVLSTRLADGTVAIDWPGGETAAALAERVAAAWRDLVADGRPAVVVSHAGPLRLAIGLADGCLPDRVELPTPAGARRRTLGVPPSRA
jgi:alpha-ribazole phosphatase